MLCLCPGTPGRLRLTASLTSGRAAPQREIQEALLEVCNRQPTHAQTPTATTAHPIAHPTTHPAANPDPCTILTIKPQPRKHARSRHVSLFGPERFQHSTVRLLRGVGVGCVFAVDGGVGCCSGLVLLWLLRGSVRRLRWLLWGGGSWAGCAQAGGRRDDNGNTTVPRTTTVREFPLECPPPKGENTCFFVSAHHAQHSSPRPTAQGSRVRNGKLDCLRCLMYAHALHRSLGRACGHARWCFVMFLIAMGATVLVAGRRIRNKQIYIHSILSINVILMEGGWWNVRGSMPRGDLCRRRAPRTQGRGEQLKGDEKTGRVPSPHTQTNGHTYTHTRARTRTHTHEHTHTQTNGLHLYYTLMASRARSPVARSQMCELEGRGMRNKQCAQPEEMIGTCRLRRG